MSESEEDLWYRLIERTDFINKMIVSKMNILLLAQSFLIIANLTAFNIHSSLAIIIALFGILIIIIVYFTIYRSFEHMKHYDREINKQRNVLKQNKVKCYLKLPQTDNFIGLANMKFYFYLLGALIFMWGSIIIVELIITHWDYICN